MLACLLAPCLCNQPHLQCADCLCCTPPASHSKAGRRRAATAFAVRPRQSRHSHLHERHVVGSSAAREYERPGSLEAAALAAGHRRLACEGKPIEALTATLAAREYEAIEALTPALAARRRCIGSTAAALPACLLPVSATSRICSALTACVARRRPASHSKAGRRRATASAVAPASVAVSAAERALLAAPCELATCLLAYLT